MKKNKIVDMLKLMRVKHYTKNIIIFFPLIFSGNLLNRMKFLDVLISFLVFSLVSSVIYITNDIKDINEDKKHLFKKYRPIASNKVTIREAIVLLLTIIIITIFSVCISNLSLKSVLFILLYIVLNITYTFYLKNKPVIDVTILSLLFIIRVLYGASVINVKVSNWLYLTIMSAAFYLALNKRKNELKINKNSRKVLKYYNNDFLNNNMYMFLSMAIIFYSLWTIDFKSIDKNGNHLIWTVPFIMIIALKYNLTSEIEKEDNPVEILLHDKWLIILIIIYGITIISILYL